MGKSEVTLDLFIPKVVLLLYLIIGVIPRFESVDPIGSQWFYFSVINLLSLFYIYANREKITVFKRQRQVYLFFGSYIAFFFVAGISIYGALNISEGVKDLARIAITLIAVMNLFLILKIAPKALFEYIVKVSHILVIYIAIQVIWVFIDSDIYRNATLLKETALGTYGTQNATAATLAIQIPFLLWGLIKHIGKWKIVSIVSLLLGISALLFIGARTAVLSAIFYVIIFLGYLIIDSARKKTIGVSLKTVLLPFLGVLLVSYLFATNINRIEASRANTFNELLFAPSLDSDIKKKKSSGDQRGFVSYDSGRGIYYEMAFDDFTSHPILGVGIGNWKLSNKDKYFANSKIDKFIYPLRVHNDFLQVLAEVGIVGFIAYLFMFIILIFSILKLFFIHQNHEDRWIYTVITLSLLAYGFDALINFPLERTPIQGHFVVLASLILAFFYTNYKKEDAKNVIIGMPILMVVAIFALSASVITYIKYTSYVTQNYVLADTTGKNLMKDTYVMSYDKIVQDLSGFFSIAGVGRPNEHVKGMYAMSEGRLDKALYHLDKAIEEAPNHYESKMLKGIIYGQRKINNDSAIFYAKQGFEKYPAIKNNYIILLNAYRAKGDTISYFNTIDTFLKRNPEDISQWQLKSKRIMDFYNDTDGAIAVIDEALEKNPDDETLIAYREKYTVKNSATDIKGWYAKAFEFIEQKKYAEAKEEFLKILEVTPSNNPTLLNLGIIEIKLKQYNATIEHLTKVIDSKKYKDGRAEYNRGLAYERLGKKDKAAIDYTRSKELGYKLALKLSDSKFE
ncbi:O-antigen ligase family protein [uncultured Dokdonia sp.]|uniref:O-antigen ligase family protein n=1 Tax=uncultured Dokdonia sp. TaxID=575653 RepID=UPI002622659C|nr:O-antigen ligase family protein [uncultured Dokdonia sp.]